MHSSRRSSTSKDVPLGSPSFLRRSSVDSSSESSERSSILKTLRRKLSIDSSSDDSSKFQIFGRKSSIGDTDHKTSPSSRRPSADGLIFKGRTTLVETYLNKFESGITFEIKISPSKSPSTISSPNSSCPSSPRTSFIPIMPSSLLWMSFKINDESTNNLDESKQALSPKSQASRLTGLFKKSSQNKSIENFEESEQALSPKSQASRLTGLFKKSSQNKSTENFEESKQKSLSPESTTRFQEFSWADLLERLSHDKSINELEIRCFSNNKKATENATELLAAMYNNKTIEGLRISGIEMEAGEIAQLLNILYASSLVTRLILKIEGLGTINIDRALGGFIHLDLGLSINMPADNPEIEILENIRHICNSNNTIKELIISKINTGVKGAIIVLDMLANNKFITELVLKDEEIGNISIRTNITEKREKYLIITIDLLVKALEDREILEVFKKIKDICQEKPVVLKLSDSNFIEADTETTRSIYKIIESIPNKIADPAKSLPTVQESDATSEYSDIPLSHLTPKKSIIYEETIYEEEEAELIADPAEPLSTVQESDATSEHSDIPLSHLTPKKSIIYEETIYEEEEAELKALLLELHSDLEELAVLNLRKSTIHEEEIRRKIEAETFKAMLSGLDSDLEESILSNLKKSTIYDEEIRKEARAKTLETILSGLDSDLRELTTLSQEGTDAESPLLGNNE